MLAGMLLHMVKTTGPIDDSKDFRPAQLPVKNVDNPVLLLEDVDDFGLSKTPPVGGLASGLGIEAGLIEDDGGLPLVDESLQIPTGEFPLIGIFEIESSRHRSFPVCDARARTRPVILKCVLATLSRIWVPWARMSLTPAASTSGEAPLGRSIPTSWERK